MDFLSLIKFLTTLKKNNNKEWFEKNRKTYEALRKQWIVFAQEMIDSVKKFDPTIGDLQAKDCIFRINRDIRFSADKSPYKTNFACAINKGGKKAAFCGYYLHIEPGGGFVAGGSWMPEAPILASIRQEIDYNLNTFENLIQAKEFKKHFGKISGETLTRPPKGYEADNPAIEYLKHKSFIAEMKLDDKLLAGKNPEKQIIEAFKAMYPFVSFLNRAME